MKPAILDEATHTPRALRTRATSTISSTGTFTIRTTAIAITTAPCGCGDSQLDATGLHLRRKCM